METIQNMVAENLITMFPMRPPEVILQCVTHPKNCYEPVTEDALLNRCIDDLLSQDETPNQEVDYDGPAMDEFDNDIVLDDTSDDIRVDEEVIIKGKGDNSKELLATIKTIPSFEDLQDDDPQVINVREDVLIDLTEDKPSEGTRAEDKTDLPVVLGKEKKPNAVLQRANICEVKDDDDDDELPKIFDFKPRSSQAQELQHVSTSVTPVTSSVRTLPHHRDAKVNIRTHDEAIQGKAAPLPSSSGGKTFSATHIKPPIVNGQMNSFNGPLQHKQGLQGHNGKHLFISGSAFMEKTVKDGVSSSKKFIPATLSRAPSDDGVSSSSTKSTTATTTLAKTPLPLPQPGTSQAHSTQGSAPRFLPGPSTSTPFQVENRQVLKPATLSRPPSSSQSFHPPRPAAAPTPAGAPTFQSTASHRVPNSLPQQTSISLPSGVILTRTSSFTGLQQGPVHLKVTPNGTQVQGRNLQSTSAASTAPFTPTARHQHPAAISGIATSTTGVKATVGTHVPAGTSVVTNHQNVFHGQHAQPPAAPNVLRQPVQFRGRIPGGISLPVAGPGKPIVPQPVQGGKTQVAGVSVNATTTTTTNANNNLPWLPLPPPVMAPAAILYNANIRGPPPMPFVPLPGQAGPVLPPYRLAPVPPPAALPQPVPVLGPGLVPAPRPGPLLAGPVPGPVGMGPVPGPLHVPKEDLQLLDQPVDPLVITIQQQEVAKLFPDVETNFVRAKLQEYYHTEDPVNIVCNHLLENADYPRNTPETHKPSTTKGEVKGMDYINVDWKKRGFINNYHSYFNQGLDLLSNDFTKISRTSLKLVMTSLFRGSYAKTKKALDDAVKSDPLVQAMVTDDSKGSFFHIKGSDGRKVEVRLMRKARKPTYCVQNMHPELAKEVDFYKEHLKTESEKNDFAVALRLNEDQYEQEGQLIECGCCFLEVTFERMVQCLEGHLFCQTCLQSYTKEAVFGQGKAALSCLEDGCDSVFPRSQLEKTLSADILEKYDERVGEESVNLAEMDNLLRCPHCNYAAVLDTDDKVFRCPECFKETCRDCKEPWKDHFGLACEEVKKQSTMRLSYHERMTEAKVRTCYKCGTKFLKSEGCNKMTCRCGAKMCYICRQPIEDYNHFDNRQPTRPGQPSQQTGGKCLLWTNAEEDDNRAVAEIEKQLKEEERSLRQKPDLKRKEDAAGVGAGGGGGGSGDAKRARTR